MAKSEAKENKLKKAKKTVVKKTKIKKKAIETAVYDDKTFNQRLDKHYDELKWLYCELYRDIDSLVYFDDLLKQIKDFYDKRPYYLKALDAQREENPDWYKGNNLTGMIMDVNCFSGTLKKFEKRLPYIEESNINFLHLTPLLSSPKKKSDGGYAVADFHNVQKELGTMEDLRNLAEKCHEKDISVCLDLVMNRTSDEHEWAVRAHSGEKEYQDRYFFFDDYSIPEMFEKDCPQVSPTKEQRIFTHLKDIDKFVMTTFYPYEWDLDYRNPTVFNEMVYNMLFLTNQGIDIIRLDDVPYIWKQHGTDCRNLPQVHSIIRMMRMISEIVCPAVLLLGEVDMTPDKAVSYFGTQEKPECHMLCNVTTIATIWHTVATRDTKLLKHQVDILSSLPKQYIFQNYLHCHDDIDWNLDYDFLRNFGIDETAHRHYLKDFFTGKFPGSFGMGELYNDECTGGLCGTTASLCGIEYYDKQKDKEAIEKAIQLDLMLHAFMLAQSGIPVIYSGDEIAQYNDYSYKEDADKRADSRYVHRSVFNWRKAGRRKIKTAIQAKIYQNLIKMEKIRNSYDIFKADADIYTLPTWEKSTLAIVRETENEKFIGVYNFSENEQMAWINETDGLYTDLLTDTKEFKATGIKMPPYSVLWLWRKKE